MNYYAHSKDEELPDHWQPLEQHLENVANRAAEFAKPFGGEEWARLAGLWHDLGKHSPSLSECSRRRPVGGTLILGNSACGGFPCI